jgi:glycerol-3-phosphate acyltransferase PlsY
LNPVEIVYPAVYPVLATLLAYLLGSLSFAVIVSRVMGLNDPRTYGSKNPGATNVLRSGSKAAAAATLLLDALKAFIPMVLLRAYGAKVGLGDGTLALVGLAAFLGHLFPIFFRFVGGKGVATALGVLLGISGWLGLACGLVWFLMARLFRYSSLAALAAAVGAPIIYLLGDGSAWDADNRLTLVLVIMAALLLWRHSANITRLLQGTEPRIGQKKG